MTFLQHQDQNVGPGYYKHLAPDELLVTKIFPTIQGEGPFAGHPAVFLRLAGCNRGRKDDMGCKFCDTAFYFSKGQRMRFAAIVEEAFGMDKPPSLLVITGGEPMMQNNLVGFIEYMNAVAAQAGARLRIQIESNGDRIAPNYDGSMADLVVSPKQNGTVDSLTGGYRLPAPDVIAAANYFKFVVSGDIDNPYYNVPVWANSLKVPVYVSPLTVYKKAHDAGAPVSAWDPELVDHEATRINYKRAASIAMFRNFRVSIQQHIWYGVE